MEDGERTLLHWVLSSLMVAEERISTQFCGLVLAQDDEEEGNFLSTQLVDEVRHMQFYARFQNEVVADPDAIAGHVERARQVLGEPFEKVFDEALVEAHERLRLDPRNRQAKVEFVTIYRMVIEGTLGITASHFLLDYLARARPASGLCGRLRPDRGRRAAPHRMRHPVPPAGGGGGSSQMAEVVHAQLVGLLPAVADSVSPPSEGASDVLGVADGELAQYGLNALNRRLALIGVSLAA